MEFRRVLFRSDRYSRVSSPDFGANRIPTNAPIPRPTRKKLILDPTLSAMACPPRISKVAQVTGRSNKSAELLFSRRGERHSGRRFCQVDGNALRKSWRHDSRDLL